VRNPGAKPQETGISVFIMNVLKTKFLGRPE
jgi:hypothetical protein